MVNYEQLLNMDTSKLTTAAETSNSLSGKLSTRGSELSSAADIPAGMWQGADSQAASSAIGGPVPFLYDSSDMFRNSKGVLETLVEDLNAAKEELQSAQDLVAGTGISIGADGTVTTPVVESPAENERNQELARQASDIIRQAVDKANAADDTAQSSLGEQGGWAEDLLKYLNGGHGEAPEGIEPSLLEKMTENPGNTSLLGGLLNLDIQHGEGTGIKSLFRLDNNEATLGIAGDPTRSMELKGPSFEQAGVTATGGSAKLHNSAIPSIGLGSVDDTGKVHIKPKIGLPFLSASGPGITVDPQGVKDFWSGAVPKW